MGELVQLADYRKRMRNANEKVLTFTVAGELYAIGIRDIKEIVEYAGITHVPMAGEPIRGVMNLRGKIVPVVGLAERLSLPSEEAAKRSCVVVITAGEGEDALDLGLAVDGIHQIATLDEHSVQPPPGFGSPIRTDFILSVARIAQRLVILLDQRRLLSLDELHEAALCR